MLKKALTETYKMTDMGQLHRSIGLRVTRDNNLLHIDQQQYAETVLKRFGMEDCRPVATPMESKIVIPNGPLLEADGIKTFQIIIGSFKNMMLATRPDICFVVAILSQFCARPTFNALQAAKRVLRYLRGTFFF